MNDIDISHQKKHQTLVIKADNKDYCGIYYKEEYQDDLEHLRGYEVDDDEWLRDIFSHTFSDDKRWNSNIEQFIIDNRIPYIELTLCLERGIVTISIN